MTDLSRYAGGEYRSAGTFGYGAFVLADEPLYAEPDGELSEATKHALVLRILDKESKQTEPYQRRRQAIFRRWLIWAHNLAPLVGEKIYQTFHKREVAENVSRHVASPMNPAVDIVGQVCCVYKNGAKRSIAKPQKPEAPEPPTLPTIDGGSESPFGKGDVAEPKGEPTEAPAKPGSVPPKGADPAESESPEGDEPKLADPAKSIKDDPAQEAFSALVGEAKIPSLEREWNCLAYFLGPLLAVPRCRGESSKRMSVDTYLPHCFEPALNPDDPYGLPAAACYAVRGGEIAIIASKHGYEGWKLAKLPNGKAVAEPAPEYDDKFESEVPPYAVLRFDTPLDPCDWFNYRRCQRLEDGTIEVAFISTLLSYVRKTQNKKLLSVVGQFDEAPKGQSLGEPERPVQLPVPDGGNLAIESLDFDTDPSNFVRHIRLLMEMMAESTGIEIVRAAGAGEGYNTDVDFSHDGLTEVRNQQLAYALDFDRALASAILREAKRNDHELASDLPEEEEFAKLFHVDYGQLSRTFADPAQEQAWVDWQLKNGWTNVIAQMKRYNPSLTSDAAARDEVFSNLAINAKWNEEITKRDMGVPQGAAKTTAEMFGAMGPGAKNAGSDGNAGDGKPGGAGFPFGKK